MHRWKAILSEGSRNQKLNEVQGPMKQTLNLNVVQLFMNFERQASRTVAEICWGPLSSGISKGYLRRFKILANNGARVRRHQMSQSELSLFVVILESGGAIAIPSWEFGGCVRKNNISLRLSILMAVLISILPFEGQAKSKGKKSKGKTSVASSTDKSINAKIKIKRKQASLNVPPGVPTELPEKMIFIPAADSAAN